MHLIIQLNLNECLNEGLFPPHIYIYIYIYIYMYVVGPKKE